MNLVAYAMVRPLNEVSLSSSRDGSSAGSSGIFRCRKFHAHSKETNSLRNHFR